MNGDRYFVGTNVILYAYDAANPTKSAQAELWLRWLWENSSGALSWQVLQEFYWNALREKFRVSPDQARYHVKLMSKWDPPDVAITLIERAWHWSDQAQLTFWDALILAAAERMRCRYLLSEDFQAGRQFDSITVLNPFETAPPA
jgi:predicted nucleic acid-binding protein